MSEFRSRKGAAPSEASTAPDTAPRKLESGTGPLVIALTIARLLITALVFSSVLSYFVTNDNIWWNHRPQFTQPRWLLSKLQGGVFLTPDQLIYYNGTYAKEPIYLALNGTIYDVSASPHLYAPGGSYHFFAGRDATRAFVTGCFTEDLTGDLRGVEEMYVPIDLDEAPVMEDAAPEMVKAARREWKVKREKAVRAAKERVAGSVKQWEGTFNGGKGGKYFPVGKVVGSDWEGKKKRPLCKTAAAGRPKTSI